MRQWGLQTWAIGLIAIATASPVWALTNTSEFMTNWDNYRYCAANSADALETCAQADVRSPSEFYIPDGIQGTLDVSTSGVVKLRMDLISMDQNISTCDSSYKLQYGNCINANCGATPPVLGTCSLSPSDACCDNTQCYLQACNGGVRQDTRCNDLGPCTSTSGLTFKVVFRGTGNGQEPIPGFFPWQYYKLLGDSPTNGSDGLGCTRTCTFTLGSSNPQFNNNDITSSCSALGDCGSGGPTNFSTVEIVGPDNEVLAIPTRGTAHLAGPYVAYGDPAKVGDYCRTQNPPPSNCP
jgi:hypothetical protein